MSRYTTSRTPHWVSPKPYTDASLRRHHYGKVLPMESDKPGFFARLFGRR